jgi:hypothetical protein
MSRYLGKNWLTTKLSPLPPSILPAEEWWSGCSGSQLGIRNVPSEAVFRAVGRVCAHNIFGWFEAFSFLF